MTAPLQVIALSFSRDAGAAERILAEVDRLRGRGVLRLLDMLFVARGQDGSIERLTIGDDEDFGALLAAVLPLSAESPASGGPGPDGGPAFEPGDAWDLAQSLQPGTASAFLLVEHQWAAPLFEAISQAGGTLIGEGFLTSQAQLVVGGEIAAMEEAAQVIAEAQAAEAEALLTTLAAGQQAAAAVAASDRIQSAAVADAVRALITAGLVEEAAAHEAVTALAEAGLLAAAALAATDEVAGASIEESLATIAAADEVAAEATSEAQARVKAASITVAEAQVLRYLPQPITFSVIADRLGISRSAAKERAERLYKRLDVHSRDEAVSRARFLGLLRG